MWRYLKMSKTLELLKNKKQEYRNFKGDLRRDMTTAKKLGFNTEVNKIEKDIGFVNEILELLEDVSVSLQKEANDT